MRRLFSEQLGTFFLVLVAAGGGMMVPDIAARFCLHVGFGLAADRAFHEPPDIGRGQIFNGPPTEQRNDMVFDPPLSV